ncbi:hypothetical protein LINPERHAP2_LOCUS16816 [Linum perenne]
MTRRF